MQIWIRWLHVEKISLGVLREIMYRASCLHSLRPPPKSTAIASRLRSSQSVPKVYARTKRYCSFHGLLGSASPVLTAIGFVNGRGQYLAPTDDYGISDAAWIVCSLRVSR